MKIVIHSRHKKLGIDHLITEGMDTFETIADKLALIPMAFVYCFFVLIFAPLGIISKLNGKVGQWQKRK